MGEPHIQDAAPTAATPHYRRLELWLLGGGLLLLAVVLVLYGRELWTLVQDEAALEAWIIQLGWFGPAALITLNALQIVVAPIPGYAVQLAAGFLFGPWWGGLWANLGLLLGGSIAFGLSRRYGRPLAAYLVGGERIERWERVTHSTSTLVWFMLLLGPTGDLPYFLGGLASVSYAKVMLLTLLIRVPSTFVVAAAGAGVMWLSWWQMVLAFALLGVMLVVFLRYQTALVDWADRQVHRRVDKQLRQDVEPAD
jgi:uncharacterized membrane protein YdjX (TVP38/TMEM64 family)